MIGNVASSLYEKDSSGPAQIHDFDGFRRLIWLSEAGTATDLVRCSVKAAPCLATARHSGNGFVGELLGSNPAPRRTFGLAAPRRFVAALLRLADTGVDRRSSMAEQRWVRTINVVAIAAFVVSASYSVFYTVLDFGSLWPVIITNSVWNVGYVLVIVVNRREGPGWPPGWRWPSVLPTPWFRPCSSVPAAASTCSSSSFR